MRKLMRITLVVVICLAVTRTGLAQVEGGLGGEGFGGGPSPRRILIRHSPELLQLDSMLIHSILHSVRDQAVRKALPEVQDALASRIQVFPYEDLREHPLGVSCAVTYSAFGAYSYKKDGSVNEKAVEAAEKVFAAMLAELQARLTSMQNANQQKAAEERNQMKNILAPSRELAQDDLEKLTAVYVAKRIDGGASSESIQQQIELNKNKMYEYELNLAGLAARRDVLERRIIGLREDATANQVDEDIVRELETVLKMREQALESVKESYKINVSSIDHVYKAQEMVSQAKIELLRARRDAVDTATAEQLAALNHELTRVMAESAEAQAFSDSTKKRLTALQGELEKQIRLESEIQGVEQRMAFARERLTRLEQRMAELEEETEYVRPVEVIAWGQ